MNVIANNGGKHLHMKVTARNPLYFEFIVDIEVPDLAHLQTSWAPCASTPAVAVGIACGRGKPISKASSPAKPANARGQGDQVSATYRSKEKKRYDWRMRQHLYYVYILASRRNGTLYIGVSTYVLRRTWSTRMISWKGSPRNTAYTFLSGTSFTRHQCGIAREKGGQTGNRAWKIELIEKITQAGTISTIATGAIALPDIPGSLCVELCQSGLGRRRWVPGS